MSGDARARAETRNYSRTAALLTVALGAAGVLTYAFFSVSSHTLDPDDYGAIVVVWSAVYIASFTFFRPIEQLLARSLAELGDHGEDAHGSVLRVAAVVQGVLVVVVVAIALALHGPIEDEMLEGQTTFFAVLIVALVAFGASFFARGFLAGQRRFRAYAILLLAEGLSRLTFALAVAVGLSDDPTTVAIGIAAAPLLSLVSIPFSIRRSERELEPPPQHGGDSAAPEFTLSAGSGFAAAVLVVMLGEQVIVNSGVLFVRGQLGASEAGYIFNVLMIVRAPLILFLAIAASLLPHLSRLRARGEDADDAAFRGATRRTLEAVAVFSAVVILTVLLAGPTLMQIAFGDTFDYPRSDLLIVAAGMAVYLCASTLSQATLAQGQARRTALCWGACAAAFAVWNVIGPLEEIRRVEVGFSAVAAILAVLLYLVYRNPHPRADDTVEPGSPRDVEVRLAIADEIA